MTSRIDRQLWQRMSPVLDVVLANEPAEWPAVLAAECAGDAELQRSIQRLLDGAEDERGLDGMHPFARARELIAEALGGGEVSPGQRIGAYEIVREIGRGGMSRVFLARRADGQFEQEAALKLPRPGLDTEIDRARFRAERQILASLNHPNIARLLDGGITESGQPYFVMEHVEGQPIDVYCDARSLSVQGRLALFLRAAEAVQYAHRSLVVHRDIKSSNIVVNAEGEVKLLDFGVARLLQRSPGAAGALLQPSNNFVTPEFAAPEQLRREQVTTLTDVYQLGVLLYRLLAGRVPYAASDGDLLAVQAAVLRGRPDAPSVAARASAPRLARTLRGDLDAIVLKAMCLDPLGRYASAESLAADVRCFLSGLPVLAQRATLAYRTWRFARRHAVETAAGVALALAILGGTGVSLWLARRAAAERDLATAASRESGAVTAFVMSLFEASDPANAPGDTLTAGALVRRAGRRAELLAGNPAAHAKMLEVTGRLYESLGLYAESYAEYERALSLRRLPTGGGTEVRAATLGAAADVLIRLGRQDAADSVARERLRLESSMPHGHPADVAAALYQLGRIAVYRGSLADAVRYHRRALEIRLQALGPDDSLTAESHIELGALFRAQGRIEDADGEASHGLRVLEQTLGPENPRVADALMQVAYLRDVDEERYREAGMLYARALEIRRRVYGDSHPLIAATLLDLAEYRSRRGDHDSAVATARRGVEIMRRVYGPDHPAVVEMVGRQAAILHAAGELDEAQRLFSQAIAAVRRLYGRDDERLAGMEVGLGRLLIDRREDRQAQTTLLDAIRIRQMKNGPDRLLNPTAEGLLGVLWAREGRYAEADSILHQAIENVGQRVGVRQSNMREAYGWLADVNDLRGRHAEASRYRAIAQVR